MRIIGGTLKGLRLNAPEKLPVRPTTDMAKEALFNILNNQFDFDEIEILDLFSGTGSVSIEFASRNTKKITAIDRHLGCVAWLKSVIEKHQIKQIQVQKADVFKLLAQITEKFDIIFADPPYDLPNIAQIPQLVLQRELLKNGGLLIVEHPTFLKMDKEKGFKEVRKYGNSSFSFFSKEN